MMPSWKMSFGSYLKTEDLQGRAVRVVIERIAEEEIGTEEKGKEKKLVAHFFGKEKSLVLNKTKCEALELITGSDDIDAWVGAQIILAPGRTKFQGKTVGCIDIKPGGQVQRPNGQPVRRAAPPPVELPPVDDVPEAMGPDMAEVTPNFGNDDIPF